MNRPIVRGFTLIEVAVALVIGIIVLGTVTALFASTIQDHRRVEVLAEMSRDGNFVGSLLSKELRQAGLGVRVPDPGPPATSADHTNAAYGSTAPISAHFYAGVLVGNATEVGILADLPRPDSQYPAYGVLHTRPTGNLNGLTAHTVMWHNENNGMCAPDSGAGSCKTGDFSTFFPGVNGCSTSGAADRTCPWGMRRVVGNERLQIFSSNGSWVHSAAKNPAQAVGIAPALPMIASVFALELQTSLDTTFWPNTLLGDAPVGTVGAGWVTTLDRVFYRFDAASNTITRQQCFGDPDPGNAGFPPETATTVPAAPAYTPGGAGTLTPAANTCTVPEIVARNVQSVAFSYFDSANNPVAAPLNSAATKAAVRRIDYDIQFGTTVNGRPLRHSVAGSVRVQQ